MSTSHHILVVGAGLTGLALAHGLQKAGIKFEVFEAEEEATFRPREWTMALHWSIPMLKALLPEHLAARLSTDATVDPSLDYDEYPNNVIPVIDGVSGALVKEIPSDGLRVSRRKLRSLCSEELPIKFGHKINSIEYDDNATTIRANFNNGLSYTGTLIVGADGGGSFVRQHIFGSSATSIPLDVIYTNNTFNYSTAEQAIHARSINPVSSMVVHPACIAMLSMQDVRDTSRPETWKSQVIMMWKGDRNGTGSTSNADKHREIKSRAQQLAEPFRSAITCMPEDVDIQYQRLAYWIPPATGWNTLGGHVVLAGDAAHAMPPHRGQGLNNSINDAFNIVEAIKKMDASNQPASIDACFQEIVERGGNEVELSRKTADMMLDYNTFRQSALFTQGLAKTV